ncbi:hypothetical protein SESBI_37430 [Sesbania bispinosa]|nr:hypothetical protein SESBI_37430 [Sesbania bispinosa]
MTGSSREECIFLDEGSNQGRKFGKLKKNDDGFHGYNYDNHPRKSIPSSVLIRH